MASKDLTQGSLLRHLLTLALPVAMAMAFQSVHALIDLAWIGSLGEDAVAALSISMQVFFIVLAVSQMIGTTALADISQRWGAGRYAEARSILSSYVAAGVVVGLVSATAAWLGAELYVGALTDDPGALEAGVAYFRVNAISFFTQLLLLVMGMGLRGSGDFTTPVRVMFLSVAINMTLDPLMIFGGAGWPPVEELGWLAPFAGLRALAQATPLADWGGAGVAGAAWATIAAQGVALGVYLVRMAIADDVTIGFGRPSFPKSFFRGLLTRGLPAGIQFLLMSAVLGVALVAMKPHGALWTGIAGAGYRVFQQGLLPIIAISQASAAICGQNAGAGRPDRVRGAAARAIGIGLGWGTLVGLVMLFKGEALGALFAKPEDLGSAALYFRYSAPMAWLVSLTIIPTFILQALGRPVLPMLAELVRVAALMAVVLGWLLPSDAPPEWTFAATSGSAVIGAIVGMTLLVRHLRGEELGMLGPKAANDG
ncbi:MAG: MATE family efflux transporter [Alphaproteobacteria bacterium]|nr:MATE family efflux transporter [Alphaproteobacteria bacterium]